MASSNARCHSRHVSRGQALVEAALVMPVLLFAFMAMAELAFLVSASYGWQRGADVLAQAAAVRVAQNPGESWKAGWTAISNQEEARAGCGTPDVEFPDGTQAGGRVEVSWVCDYDAILVHGFSLPATTVTSVAVIPYVAEAE